MTSLTGPGAPILRLSPSATDLAVVDSRVKLWSVAQQRSTDVTQALSKGSSDVYTCASWGSQTGGSGRLLLLGTQAGEVRCFDAARSELVWTASGAVDGGVASVSCSPDAGEALVVGRTGGAALLDLAKGTVAKKFQASKHQLSRAAALPGRLALVVGSGVQLLDAGEGSRLHKFTGHANPVAAVAASADGRFLATSAEGERHVAVWSAAASKSGKRKHKSAVAQLALDQPAAQLEIVGAGDSSAAFHVAALTQGGGVWLFECSPSSGGAVEAVLWGRCAAGSAPVLALGLESGSASGLNLLVVTGSTARPVFQRLHVDRRAAGVAEFVVEAPQEGALLGSHGTAAVAVEGSNSAAAAAAGGKKQGVQAAVVDAGAGAVLASKVAGAKRGAEQVLGEDDGAAATVYDDEEEGQGPAEGPTFAERLAALQLQEGPGGSSAAQHGGIHGGGGAAGKAMPPPSGPLKADSLGVLLSQALQSGDRALLERCLTVRNEGVIRKTAARLGPSEAALFLKATVQRLQSAPGRGEQLAAWIRAVLLTHAGSLVAMHGMQATLSTLYQLIEARLATYQPLLSLAGRLDVVLAAAQLASGAAGGATGRAAADGPLVTVEVGSGSAVEVEDAYAGANALVSDSEDDDEGSEWEEAGEEEGLGGDLDVEEEEEDSEEED